MYQPLLETYSANSNYFFCLDYTYSDFSESNQYWALILQIYSFVLPLSNTPVVTTTVNGPYTYKSLMMSDFNPEFGCGQCKNVCVCVYLSPTPFLSDKSNLIFSSTFKSCWQKKWRKCKGWIKTLNKWLTYLLDDTYVLLMNAPLSENRFKKILGFFPFYCFFCPLRSSLPTIRLTQGTGCPAVLCAQLVGSGSAINHHHFHHLL